MFAIIVLLLGATPLSYAIYGCGSTPVVRFLLDRGAKPNKADIDGITPLHFATMTGFFLPLCMYLSTFITCKFIHAA